MKKYACALLTVLLLTCSLCPVLADGCGYQEIVWTSEPEYFTCDSNFISSLLSGDFSSLGQDVPSSTQTWQDANGDTWVLMYYPETVTYDCNGSAVKTVTSQQPTSDEILQILDWIDSQVKTEASVPGDTWNAYDPAVFQTARPATDYGYDVYQPAQQTVDYSYDHYQPAQQTVDYGYDVYQPAQPSVSYDAPVQITAPKATAVPVQVTAPQATQPPTVSTGDYTTISTSAQEQKLLNLINEDRARNGLSALSIDPELSRLAKLKSDDMNSNNYFSHESPTYGNAGQMLTTFNYDYQGVGENIAHYGTVEKAEAAFMSSDGHRRNILGSQWDKVGLGVTYDENGYVYVTELFAR